MITPPPRLRVIPPISRDEQVRLMPSQQMVTKRARNRIGIEAARSPLQHADGSKRRRRKSKRERDAIKAREDKHFEHMPKDGHIKRPKIH